MTLLSELIDTRHREVYYFDGPADEAWSGGERTWYGYGGLRSESVEKSRSQWATLPEDRVRYVEIPSAYVDGIHDDLIGRSNFERLSEDYPDTFVTLVQTYSDSLLIRLDFEDDDYETMAGIIRGLEDYPLYDDEDHSRREWDRFEETLKDALGDAERSVNGELEDDDSDETVESIRERVYAMISDAGQWCRDEDVRYDEVEEMYREARAALVSA